MRTDPARSRARAEKRQERVKDAAELAALGGIPLLYDVRLPDGTELKATRIAPKRFRTAPGRKQKRKRAPSRKKQIDGIKKRLLGVGGKWSKAVRARDGKCVMCHKTDTLQAHHWLFRRGHSMALAVDIANGATLCYGCHIGRVHHDGDGNFIFRLGDTMTAIVGPAKVAEMRLTAQTSQPLSLKWWQGKEAGFDAVV